MGSHPKIFLFAVIALLLLAASQIYAADEVSFSWTKVLSEPAIGIDWSPSGDSIIFGDQQTSQIAMLNWHTGKIAWRTSFPNPSEFSALPFFVRWSPDGKSVAVTEKGDLYLIEPQAGELKALIANTDSQDKPIYVNVRWSPDSNSVAALNWDGAMDIFSIKTGKIAQTIDIAGEMRGAGLRYSGFDWSPDGKLFAAPRDIDGAAIETTAMGFWDRDGNLLKAYSRESQTDTVPSQACSVYGDLLQSSDDIEWANDSRTLAVAGMWGYGVCRLNIDGTVDDRHISDYPISTLRWSPDQKWLVGALNTFGDLWITAIANNYQTKEMQPDPRISEIDALAWSPDSQHLAVGNTHELWIGTLQPPA